MFNLIAKCLSNCPIYRPMILHVAAPAHAPMTQAYLIPVNMVIKATTL